MALTDIAKENEDLEMYNSYWNTYYCQSKLIIHNEKAFGNYCKNRYCTTCNSIRKADIINRYYDTIEKWEDPHFVTLTVKACSEKNLSLLVEKMRLAFNRIKNRLKKREQRGKSFKLVGIKSMECNFNPIKRTYNPHFHLIVNCREMAWTLKKEWLKQWKPKDPNVNRYKFTTPKAQDIRPMNDLEHDLVEIIKYSAKVFHVPDEKDRYKLPKDPIIYAKALHNIYSVFRKKRIFDRFGFILPKQAPKTNNSKWIDTYEEFEYSIKNGDWLNKKDDTFLTDYEINKELEYFLSECLNMELS